MFGEENLSSQDRVSLNRLVTLDFLASVGSICSRDLPCTEDPSASLVIENEKWQREVTLIL